MVRDSLTSVFNFHDSKMSSSACMCNMTHSDGMSVCNLPQYNVPGARNLIVSIRALNNESISKDENSAVLPFDGRELL